jgi:hypothetical protein
MSKRLIAQAVTLYRSFREAIPKRLMTVRFNVPKVVACMGYVEGIDYRTTHGKKTRLYHHDFAPGSRPLLCVSADGRQLMLIGGRYEWDERGIVDKDAAGQDIIPDDHHRKPNPKRAVRDPAHRKLLRELAGHFSEDELKEIIGSTK